jgi:hypothetical protein
MRVPDRRAAARHAAVAAEGDRVHALKHFIGAEALGARRDVMHRAEYAGSTDRGRDRAWRAARNITVNLSFDEFSVAAAVDYVGIGLQFPEQRPSADRSSIRWTAFVASPASCCVAVRTASARWRRRRFRVEMIFDH